MRRLLGGAMLVASLLGLLALAGPPAWANAEMGDLSGLPGCAGQCHDNGGFTIDPETGEKISLKKKKKKKKDANCKTRTKCGPVFCQKMKTCCNDDDECETKPVGKSFPNPDAEEDEGDEKKEEKAEKKKPELNLNKCVTFDVNNPDQSLRCEPGAPTCGEPFNNKVTCCCPK